MKQDKKEVINLGNLGYYINKIEEMFKEENINVAEQSLILQHAIKRLDSKEKRQMVDDLLSTVPLGGFVKRFLKSRDEGGNEDGS